MTNAMIGELALDPIDYRIIELLQNNSRISQTELAEEVGLSQPSVAERLHKLERARVIVGYTALIDARVLGRDITAFIGVAIDHPKHNGAFARAVLRIPDILECHRVTGADSYLLKVKTQNTATLDRLICETIRRIPGVTRTLTTVVMASVKEDTRIKPINPKPLPGATARRKQPRATPRSSPPARSSPGASKKGI